MKALIKDLISLQSKMDGDLFFDEYQRVIHASDASVYQEQPIAVARPKNENDIQSLIQFARDKKVSLIPRAAGTSIAGQVVGGGIVVDISKYFTRIVEFNQKEKWVIVEPGVIRDALNAFLKSSGLFFGPETSTSDRCMLGGMVGNNACGLHSLIYGSTRDHLISVKGFLSDGSEVEFGPLNNGSFNYKCKQNDLEGKIYRQINEIFKNEDNIESIKKEYPHPTIKRRNTGYALDILLNTDPFSGNKLPFNLAKLIAGSEGTLMFITEIKLSLSSLPPKRKHLICVHYNDLQEAFNGNLIALNHQPTAIELMDGYIIEMSRRSTGFQMNSFFIKDEPAAILMIELVSDEKTDLQRRTEFLIQDMKDKGSGYHYPVLADDDINKAWDLRKAGLGMLSKTVGDRKPVPVVEDTAVLPEDLPVFIEKFDQLLASYQLKCAYYAHIATGELHLRPVLNLKDEKDVKIFRELAEKMAYLVKKYKGSLSGEHGDGRLRGEFISIMLGENNFRLIKEIKNLWDPHHIFNPGKIVHTPPMNTSLRYEPEDNGSKIESVFDFSKEGGLLSSIEKCTGSAVCRRPVEMGGSMCPSYQATLDEDKTTRARANILRTYISDSKRKNPFDHSEIFKVLDLCLSCKACKSECPSSVDMARLKAEALQHYYLTNNVSLKTLLFANIHLIQKWGSASSIIYNFILQNKLMALGIKKILGLSVLRSFPLLQKTTLKKWIKRFANSNEDSGFQHKVYLFVDEFTNYQDVNIGIKAVKLFNLLGYKVEVPKHDISGRALVSQGFVKRVKAIANKNVLLLNKLISDKTPLIGIEPSAILTFRDEYPDLVDKHLQNEAIKLSENTFLIEEFFMREVEKGNILKSQFSNESKKMKYHGHCHQKALASTSPTLQMLSFPENYEVEEIPSGCCGMAGSFGYDNDHYDLSMKIGEMKLFPEIRNVGKEIEIVASGTSCRQQILDGTKVQTLHPVEIIYKAILK